MLQGQAYLPYRNRLKGLLLAFTYWFIIRKASLDYIPPEPSSVKTAFYRNRRKSRQILQTILCVVNEEVAAQE